MRKVTIILFGATVAVAIITYGVLQNTYPPESEQFKYVLMGHQAVQIGGILLMVTFLIRGVLYMIDQNKKSKAEPKGKPKGKK